MICNRVVEILKALELIKTLKPKVLNYHFYFFNIDSLQYYYMEYCIKTKDFDI